VRFRFNSANRMRDRLRLSAAVRAITTLSFPESAAGRNDNLRRPPSRGKPNSALAYVRSDVGDKDCE
jgi:hypothetical protein